MLPNKPKEREREREKERERERQRELERGEKDGNRGRDSVEEKKSGRQEISTDTLLRETEGVIK